MAALRRWRLWRRILDTPPTLTDSADGQSSVEIHILCSEHDYLCAIWALKSFYHYAGVAYPLAIHLQGWCPKRTVSKLRKHFPGARIILQSEADASVGDWLSKRGLLRLRALRAQVFIIQKLTDFLLACRAPRLFMLDSDVLFFAAPRHLVEAANAAPNAALFQHDLADNYDISACRAGARFGIRMARRINAGLAMVPCDAINLARCDELLSDEELARPTGLIEQTLWALLAGERIAVRHLPDSYLISLQPCPDVQGLIARHYAGPSRSFLNSEGLPALIAAGFLKALGNAH